MNKDELLKIYSAHLPYKTPITLASEAYNYDGLTTILSPHYLLDWQRNKCKISLHLWDLSYLTKEIEHEWKKITPIVELAKLGTGEQECGVTNGNLGTCYVNAKNEKKGFFIYHPEGYFIWQVGKNAEPMIVKNQLKLFQKLLEWHFNIFSLPESEYINKATLTQKQ